MWTSTSSPSSPTAGRSSKALTTPTRRRRSTRSTWGIERIVRGRYRDDSMTTYLDNAATSFPKPEAVYAALDRCARTQLANPGRAGHKMALASERLLDDGRHRLNQMFHGEGPERFIFTLNCTDALNIAFKGVLQPGDHVVTTDLEHNSVSRPLRALELAGVITLTRVAADGAGTIDPDAIRRAITAKTRLIALGHASNV